MMYEASGLIREKVTNVPPDRFPKHVTPIYHALLLLCFVAALFATSFR